MQNSAARHHFENLACKNRGYLIKVDPVRSFIRDYNIKNFVFESSFFVERIQTK